MKIIEKILLTVCILGTLSVLLISVKMPNLQQTYEMERTGGGASVLNKFYLTSNVGGSTQSGEISATTTRTYMKSTQSASSTLVAYTERAESLETNLTAEASTTATIYAWSYQSSDDGITWYEKSCAADTSNVLQTYGPGACIHSWTPGTTATSTKSVTISTLGSKYTRVKFGTMSANGALHVLGITKEQNPN